MIKKEQFTEYEVPKSVDIYISNMVNGKGFLSKEQFTEYEVPKSVDIYISNMVNKTGKKTGFRMLKAIGIYAMLGIFTFGGGYYYVNQYKNTSNTTEYNQTISTIDSALSDLETIQMT